MNPTLTIAQRELKSFFFSPIAYVVLGAFGLGVTLVFFRSYGSGEPAVMRPTYDWVVWLLVFLAPAISMRGFAEELRAGTFETLMTSPVSDGQVVLGKFLGCFAFMLIMLGVLLTHVAALELTADPDYGPVFTGLLGLVLVGALYLAIGLVSSALTQNQIIAFILSVLMISLLTFAMFFLPRWSALGEGLREAAAYINVNRQYQDFSKGLINVRNLVYFISGIAMFLFIAVKLVESRRWR